MAEKLPEAKFILAFRANEECQGMCECRRYTTSLNAVSDRNACSASVIITLQSKRAGLPHVCVDYSIIGAKMTKSSRLLHPVASSRHAHYA